MDVHDTYPWYFFRDEFDLIEEDLDAVFHSHEKLKRHGKVERMEDEVLEEQVATEERFERDLEKALGPAALDQSPPHVHDDAAGMEEPRSLRALLHDRPMRDPFGERAFAWARGLFRWSGAAYDVEGRKERDFFRIYVNACLVPMKISHAREDEAMGDAASAFIAAKEYELALVYATRTIESLSHLCADEAMARELGGAIAEGALIQTELERICADLRQRQGYRGFL